MALAAAAGIAAALRMGGLGAAPTAAIDWTNSARHQAVAGHVRGTGHGASARAGRIPAKDPDQRPAGPGSLHRRAGTAQGAAPRSRSSSEQSRSTAPARASAIRCSGSSGMLPANYATIVGFLTAHGYTGLAAAGIAGNIYQESKGDPEAVGMGGGGLIGWTPLPAGYVTGNPAADLRTQLVGILSYNQQWAQYIPALNAATSASQAADIYMNDFERPGLPMAANREAAAAAVAAACRL